MDVITNYNREYDFIPQQVVPDETVLTKEIYLQYLEQEKIALENFILRVKNEVSIGCQLPIKLPDSNLMNILSECKKWFYKHYEYSVQESYLLVKSIAFDSDDFKKSRAIRLPDDVYSVFGVYKMGSKTISIYNSASQYSNEYIPIAFDTMIQDDIMCYIIEEAYLSLRRDLLDKSALSFNFNNLTHKIMIMGQIPPQDLILTVYRTIKDSELFEDDLFFRYVVAKVNKNIAKVLGLFSYNLPGGVQLNVDAIQSLGQDEIDKIEEEIKTTESADYFFVAGGRN